MGYTVNYMGTPAEMEAKALADVMSYLGGESELKKLKAKVQDFYRANPSMSTANRYRAVRFSLSMYVGIEGYYPVRAILRYVGLKPVAKLTLVKG